MKTIYLHVGNFKTGTSAIQRYCSDNQKELMDCGIDYLEVARPRSNPTNHGMIPLSLQSKYGEFIPSWYDDNESFEAVFYDVKKAVDNSPCNNIVISSEEFYRIPGLRKITVEHMQNNLRELFEGYDVKLLMYVRPPLDMLKSWYNEVNKANKPSRRFTDFFYVLDKSILLPTENAIFWRKCFGTRNLSIESYELNGQLHIEHFLKLVGVNIQKAPPRSEALVNKKRDEHTLERDRISRILQLSDKKEREKYLRSVAFMNTQNFEKLQSKIDRINHVFSKFCQDEGLDISNGTLNLRDLLIHEEEINRKDVVTTSLDYLKARTYNLNILRALKKFRRRN